VGQQGEVLSEDSGTKFYNTEIDDINEIIAINASPAPGMFSRL
jgi:hypothetical protein